MFDRISAVLDRTLLIVSRMLIRLDGTLAMLVLLDWMLLMLGCSFGSDSGSGVGDFA